MNLDLTHRRFNFFFQNELKYEVFGSFLRVKNFYMAFACRTLENELMKKISDDFKSPTWDILEIP